MNDSHISPQKESPKPTETSPVFISLLIFLATWIGAVWLRIFKLISGTDAVTLMISGLLFSSIFLLLPWISEVSKDGWLLKFKNAKDSLSETTRRAEKTKIQILKSLVQLSSKQSGGNGSIFVKIDERYPGLRDIVASIEEQDDFLALKTDIHSAAKIVLGGQFERLRHFHPGELSDKASPVSPSEVQTHCHNVDAASFEAYKYLYELMERTK